MKNYITGSTLRRLTISAMLLAVALLLPFAVGQIPQLGKALLPMHLPVLLCGFICGGPWGLVVGFVTPLLRNVLFHHPEIYPTGIAMAFELATYGAVSGFLYRVLPKKTIYIYVSLLSAMLAGRIVWGCVTYALTFAGDSPLGLAAFWGQAFVTAAPGIIIQVILIPIIVMALRRARMIAE